MDNKTNIAKRVAKELHHGDVVNLGIGLPTLVANYIPEGTNNPPGRKRSPWRRSCRKARRGRP